MFNTFRVPVAVALGLLIVSPMAAQHTTERDHVNRLIDETSPYLLQHARNPVDWYAWGDEAFEAARAAGKPIFLSIGYSTCYWCHVMERESFENEEIAALMNEHFISIKVDREERPDVDDIYMAATQIYNRGQGGWPMSVFLDPVSLKPFVAGTYFPPEDRFQRPGFPTVLTRVSELWSTRREDLIKQADQLAELVARDLSRAGEPVPVGRPQVDQAIDVLLTIYDVEDGGFGRGSNKFPMPAYLDLLLGAGWDREQVRAAVLYTLDRMATGGMYDQVGGGFHRYSTDPHWLVPHFEKMLYDNGQLASTYATAFEKTGDAYYAEIVRETLDYVRREMTDPGGGFFGAQDAEVNAREGQNYIWVEDEIRDALAAAGLADEIDFTLDVYGFREGTNFQDPHHPEDRRRNVVFLRARPDTLAGELGLELDEFNDRLRGVNAALLKVRDTRDQPGTDDKVLAGWNGLMIGGFADGGRVLEDDRYLDAARRAAAFVLDNMRDGEGGLLRAYRADRAGVGAVLEDYALMIRGLLALNRATGESRWLDEAVALARGARERFWDVERGAYYDTLADQSDLFVRTKTTYDGAVPCGNSVMLNNLVDLAELTGEQAWMDDAVAALEGLSGAIAANPVSTSGATLALARIAAAAPERTVTTAAVPGAEKAVTVTLSDDLLELPATLDVTLTIADGFHINAHEPGQAFLIGLDIRLVGVEGVTATPDYPEGELYREEIRIHEGTLTIPVALSKAGTIDGEPRLAVTYQVCTDQLCLAPTTDTVPLRLAGP